MWHITNTVLIPFCKPNSFCLWQLYPEWDKQNNLMWCFQMIDRSQLRNNCIKNLKLVFVSNQQLFFLFSAFLKQQGSKYFNWFHHIYGLSFQGAVDITWKSLIWNIQLFSCWKIVSNHFDADNANMANLIRYGKPDCPNYNQMSQITNLKGREGIVMESPYWLMFFFFHRCSWRGFYLLIIC